MMNAMRLLVALVFVACASCSSVTAAPHRNIFRSLVSPSDAAQESTTAIPVQVTTPTLTTKEDSAGSSSDGHQEHENSQEDEAKKDARAAALQAMRRARVAGGRAKLLDKLRNARLQGKKQDRRRTDEEQEHRSGGEGAEIAKNDSEMTKEALQHNSGDALNSKDEALLNYLFSDDR